MKLQYLCYYDEDAYYISTYCDGLLTNEQTFTDDNKAFNYLNRIQKEGYTLAFTDEEIKSIFEHYEYMLTNRLMKKEK